jgi:hypothetical protein
MAEINGIGPCLIPGENDLPCGKQIVQGEAIGTVVLSPGGPTVGHKRCSDAYHARKQQAEREKRNAMVQRMDQGGAGGAVNYSSARDAIQGSIPLDKPLAGDQSLPGAGELSALASAVGVHSIAEVPLEATPDDAVRLAEQAEKRQYTEFVEQLKTNPPPPESTGAPDGGHTHTITVDLTKLPPGTEQIQVIFRLS